MLTKFVLSTFGISPPVFAATICVFYVLSYYIRDFIRSKIMGIPTVRGGYPYLGQVFAMLKGSPWDTMVIFIHLFFLSALLLLLLLLPFLFSTTTILLELLVPFRLVLPAYPLRLFLLFFLLILLFFSSFFLLSRYF